VGVSGDGFNVPPWVLLLDREGGVIRDTILRGYAVPQRIILLDVTEDGDAVFAGGHYVWRVALNGELRWVKTLNCNVICGFKHQNGDYYLAGNISHSEFRIQGIGADGIREWGRNYQVNVWSGGVASLTSLPNGSLIGVGCQQERGATARELLLISMDDNCNENWMAAVPGCRSDDMIMAIGHSDDTLLVFNYGSADPDEPTGMWLTAFDPTPEGVRRNRVETHPIEFLIYPPYPNPFNSSTLISFEVIHPGFVRLGIYEQGGRLVTQLRQGWSPGGSYKLVWNSKEVPSGRYTILMQSGDQSQWQGATLVR